jgi:hypothetical protein
MSEEATKKQKKTETQTSSDVVGVDKETRGNVRSTGRTEDAISTTLSDSRGNRTTSERRAGRERRADRVEGGSGSRAIGVGQQFDLHTHTIVLRTSLDDNGSELGGRASCEGGQLVGHVGDELRNVADVGQGNAENDFKCDDVGRNRSGGGTEGLTQRAGEARTASTREAVQQISASSAVSARVGSTFVDVGLTERARVASNTGAREAIDSIDTSSTIATRVGGTFVDIGLAEKAE